MIKNNKSLRIVKWSTKSCFPIKFSQPPSLAVERLSEERTVIRNLSFNSIKVLVLVYINWIHILKYQYHLYPAEQKNTYSQPTTELTLSS